MKGLDGHELATMIAAVGRFADLFDDQLIAEFYVDHPEATNQAPIAEEGEAEAAVEASSNGDTAATRQPQTD